MDNTKKREIVRYGVIICLILQTLMLILTYVRNQKSVISVAHESMDTPPIFPDLASFSIYVSDRSIDSPLVYQLRIDTLVRADSLSYALKGVLKVSPYAIQEEARKNKLVQVRFK